MTAEPPPNPRRRPSGRLRLLRLLPTGIALLWIAGVAQFRDMALQPLDFAALVAAAFALQVILARMRGPERPIVLPAGANPTVVAVLAAAITGFLGLVLGGLLEATVPAGDSTQLPPWWLRTLWHGACAFGAAYCRFLWRVSMIVPPPSSPQG